VVKCKTGEMYMFKLLFRALKEMLFWFRHRRTLNSMTEKEQFRDYILRVQPQKFLQYQKAFSQKRLEFQSVASALGLNLKGIKFLDIGPGHGDSLDICYEEGAKCIDFVEIDSFFFTYNRLKGFTKGYQVNHMSGLTKLDLGKYDLIWVKGSISADRFITINKWKIKNLSLSHWLTSLERLASSTCQIIICPHWSNDTRKRNIKDVQHNLFTETMLNKGYVISSKIRNHNYDPEYPITFYKNMSRTSPGSVEKGN
jgi:hypothetical protein